MIIKRKFLFVANVVKWLIKKILEKIRDRIFPIEECLDISCISVEHIK